MSTVAQSCEPSENTQSLYQSTEVASDHMHCLPLPAISAVGASTSTAMVVALAGVGH